MKAVKTINPKYGVPTSKPRGSEITRVAPAPEYRQGEYKPRAVTTEADDVEFMLTAKEVDPVKSAVSRTEISFNNFIGRIEKAFKRMKVVTEYTVDGYFQVWIDTTKYEEMFTYYIGVGYDKGRKCFSVLDAEEREIMCVDGNELSHILSWLKGFNDIDGRGKLLLRTDLIEE